MRFLIVNGYSYCEIGRRKFENFRREIIKFISSQKELIDTENEYYIRDRENVEDFLYEQENSHIKEEYGKQFDQIDIVFISGNANARPWSVQMRKIVTLIRMCLKTNKLLYTGSFGTQVLAFLCATNFTVYAKVVNKSGEGCKLTNFPQYIYQAQHCKQNDYFLDSTTGDLYSYNADIDEWIPKVNVGIHNRRDAMEFQSIGKYIIKSPTYQPKTNINLEQNETVCQIKKQFFHHWPFKDVQTEFQVSILNSWDIHTFTFTNPKRVNIIHIKFTIKKFQVLAECNQRGPLILECQHILATMFEMDSKHRETVTIVKNFVDHALRTNNISILNDKFFKENDGLLDNIGIVYFKKENKQTNGNPEEIYNNQKGTFLQEQRKLGYKFESHEKFFHVGFSVKKSRLPDFYDQNLITEKRVKGKQRQMKSSRRIKSEGSKSGIFNTIRKDRVALSSIKDKISEPEPLIRGNSQKAQYTEVVKRLKQQLNIMEQPMQKKELMNYTQCVVRNMLHPEIDPNCTGEQQLWIPGVLNERRKQKKAQKLKGKWIS